jgi:methionyl aminopeptidase
MPNFANHDHRRLPQGLVVAIEPIIATGTREVVMDTDGWTVRTRDGSHPARPSVGPHRCLINMQLVVQP